MALTNKNCILEGNTKCIQKLSQKTLMSGYGNNCFIRNWIIRKSRVTGKLTKVKLTV